MMAAGGFVVERDYRSLFFMDMRRFPLSIRFKKLDFDMI